jgi:LacI family transcriptional regulator
MHIALVFSLEYSFCRGALRGIRAFALAHAPDWQFNLISPNETRRLPRMLRSWKPHGAICFAHQSLGQMIASLGKPVVNLSNASQDLAIPRVGVDDRAVGRMAAEHFLDRGYKHFGFFGTWNHHFGMERLAGFHGRLLEAGLDCVVAPSAQSSRKYRKPSEERTVNWLVGLPKPVAVLAENDAYALELAELCHQRGLRVPEQVALLGVDDTDILCSFGHPPLSSVALPLQRIGFEAAALLRRLLAGEAAPKTTLLPPVGVTTRHSTDVLAIEDVDVAEAVRFIRENIHEPIGVDHVLRHVTVSRRALERRFRTILNRSPLDEIRRARIALAKELLTGTDLSMPQVAKRCGFLSAERLAVVFHSDVGIPPTAFRRQSRL